MPTPRFAQCWKRRDCYTLYLDQRPRVRVEPGTPLGPAEVPYFTIQNGAGAWRVHGARFYELPK